MSHFYSRVSFIVGIVLGIILATYLHGTLTTQQPKVRNYRTFSQKQFKTGRIIPWDLLRYTNGTYQIEADYLFKTINIHCIILVKVSSNFKAINQTWGKTCTSITPIHLESRNKIMPSKQDKDKSSWILLCKLLQNIKVSYNDWILVARDSSYFILENLRYYVAPLDGNELHYLGHAVKFWGTIYNNGEPGYVFNGKSLERFRKHVSPEECMRNSYWNKEDYYLGKYFATLNITPTNTVDENGLSTFHPYTWYHLFNPGEGYFKDSVYPVKCCSELSIAFMATEGAKMYTYNYLIYKLQIFNEGSIGNLPYLESVPERQVWKTFLRSQNISDEVTSDEYYKVWENLVNDPNSFARNLKKEQLFDDE